jgi:hypothetical protein
MKLTHDVISDLWPVYEAGEASADTRALVEEYLAQNPEFAARLRAGLKLPGMEAQMSHDAETLALKKTRDLVLGRGWLRGVRLFASVMTVFAITRIVQDTTWTVPATRFVAEAVMAAVAWALYVTVLMQQRRKALGG